jgi:hypothetical protein
MGPEQVRGEIADNQADQFSSASSLLKLCVKTSLFAI